MGLQISKTTDSEYNPIWLKILEDIPGGVTVAAGDVKTDTVELRAGTVIGKDPDTSGLYRICKSAEVYADSASTAIKVLKAQEFKVDDYISNGQNSSKITDVDVDSSDDYDTITVVNGFEVSDGDILYESTGEGTDAADIAQKYTPYALTKNTAKLVRYEQSGAVTLANIGASAIVRGTVNESLLYYPIPTATKTALTDRIMWA